MRRIIDGLIEGDERLDKVRRQRDDWKRQWASAVEDIALVQAEREAALAALRAVRVWVDKDRRTAEEWGIPAQIGAAKEMLALIDAALPEDVKS